LVYAHGSTLHDTLTDTTHYYTVARTYTQLHTSNVRWRSLDAAGRRVQLTAESDGETER